MLDFLLFISPLLLLFAVFGSVEYIVQRIRDRRSYHQRVLRRMRRYNR